MCWYQRAAVTKERKVTEILFFPGILAVFCLHENTPQVVAVHPCAGSINDRESFLVCAKRLGLHRYALGSIHTYMHAPMGI